MTVSAAMHPDEWRVFLYVFAFIFGAIWGSFLNVVIYRLPRGMSLSHPGSRCPECETPIKPYDNSPILGWLMLRGRCRSCKTWISPRYPAIELLMAVISLGLAVKVFGTRLEYADIPTLVTPYIFLFFFCAALVSLFFIDLDVTELPPEITIPGIGLGLLYAWLTNKGYPLSTLTPNITVIDSLAGAMIGAGIILALYVGYLVLTGRVGLGGGDMWMMGMVGAFVGWQGLLFIYLASSLQGIVVAVVMMGLGHGIGGEEDTAEEPAQGFFRNQDADEMEAELRGEEGGGEEENEHRDFGKMAVPFGPFIALSALEYLFLGHIIMPALSSGLLGPNGFLR